MLAELLEHLVDLAKASSAAKFHSRPEFPGRVFIEHGGGYSSEDVPPPRRKHHLSGLADVVLATRDKAIAPDPEVYYDGGRVVALLDRSTRVERVTLELARSERWQTLQNLRSHPRTLSPAEAVRLLRFDLHGTGVDALVSELGRVDFNRSSNGSHTAEHGRESLGKSVEASVQQADRVPESFAVDVAPFTNPGLRSLRGSVKVGVYVDTGAEGFEIRPLADELELLEANVMAGLRDLLGAELDGSCPLFHGAP